MTSWEKMLRIVLSVLFVAVAALLSRMFTDITSDWYQGLTLPALQPPPIAFSIAWGVIYLLFAVSLSLVSVKSYAPSSPPSGGNPAPKRFSPFRNLKNKSTLMLYIGIGVLNVLWSYTFFVLENPAGALFVLIITIITAALLIADAFKLNKAAGYLLIPYLIWLCFALYLNYEIAFLN